MCSRHLTPLVLLACGSLLRAQTITELTPNVEAGHKATGKGAGLTAVKEVTLQAVGKPPVIAAIDSASQSDTNLSFTVPAPTASGTYTVVLAPGGPVTPKLAVTAAAAPVPAQALSHTRPAPIIESVFPTTPSPVENGFNFEISGRNFSSRIVENSVNVEGQGDIPFLHSEVPGGCKQYLTNPDQLPCLEAFDDGRRLSIFGFKPRYAYQGPIKVKVLVDGVESNSWSLTPSRVNYRLLFGLFLLFVLVLVPIILAGKIASWFSRSARRLGKDDRRWAEIGFTSFLVPTFVTPAWILYENWSLIGPPLHDSIFFLFWMVGLTVGGLVASLIHQTFLDPTPPPPAMAVETSNQTESPTPPVLTSSR